MIRPVAAMLLLAAAVPAGAAERGYTITSFDRIRVEGPYAVSVANNRGSSVRATGSPAALDEVIVRVDGRTLVVRRDTQGWGGPQGDDRGPVTIAITVPQLTAASLAGSGSLTIDAMRAARVDLVVEGAGRLRLGRVETDRLAATVVGAGTVAVAGQAADARLIVRGAGTLDAARLTAADATVTADGSATVRLAVRRAVTVTASGSGSVTIDGATIGGTPACTVHRTGAAEVTCGGGRR